MNCEVIQKCNSWCTLHSTEKTFNVAENLTVDARSWRIIYMLFRFPTAIKICPAICAKNRCTGTSYVSCYSHANIRYLHRLEYLSRRSLIGYKYYWKTNDCFDWNKLGADDKFTDGPSPSFNYPKHSSGRQSKPLITRPKLALCANLNVNPNVFPRLLYDITHPSQLQNLLIQLVLIVTIFQHMPSSLSLSWISIK